MEMKYTDITVRTKLDEKTFKRFARFDMLVLRKKWIRPAVFSLIIHAGVRKLGWVKDGDLKLN